MSSFFQLDLPVDFTHGVVATILNLDGDQSCVPVIDPELHNCSISRSLISKLFVAGLDIWTRGILLEHTTNVSNPV